jgi:hypothetical protein
VQPVRTINHTDAPRLSPAASQLTQLPQAPGLQSLNSPLPPLPQTQAVNVHVNVVGGYRVDASETAADLPLLAAVASSYLDAPLPPRTLVVGEVGLRGELRGTANMEVGRVQGARAAGGGRRLSSAHGRAALSPRGGVSVVRGRSTVADDSAPGSLLHCRQQVGASRPCLVAAVAAVPRRAGALFGRAPQTRARHPPPPAPLVTVPMLCNRPRSCGCWRRRGCATS